MELKGKGDNGPRATREEFISRERDFLISRVEGMVSSTGYFHQGRRCWLLLSFLRSLSRSFSMVQPFIPLSWTLLNSSEARRAHQRPKARRKFILRHYFPWFLSFISLSVSHILLLITHPIVSLFYVSMQIYSVFRVTLLGSKGRRNLLLLRFPRLCKLSRITENVV